MCFIVFITSLYYIIAITSIGVILAGFLADDRADPLPR